MKSSEYKKLSREDRKKIPWKAKPTSLKVSIVFFGLSMLFLLVIVIIVNSEPSFKPKYDFDTTNKIKVTEQQAPIKPAIISELSREIKSLDKPYTPDRSSVENIIIELTLVNYYAGLIEKGLASQDSEANQLAVELKQKIKGFQRKELPKIRKAYADVVKSKLWENDINVHLYGNRSDVIMFVGSYFAANKNIKESQEGLNSMLWALRFKQTRYAWYEGSEYQYYEMKPLPDDSVRVIALK